VENKKDRDDVTYDHMETGVSCTVPVVHERRRAITGQSGPFIPEDESLINYFVKPRNSCNSASESSMSSMKPNELYTHMTKSRSRRLLFGKRSITWSTETYRLCLCGRSTDQVPAGVLVHAGP